MNKKYENRLDNGEEFKSWEKPLEFSKTYFVDCNSANASDDGPGTVEKPFSTISKAAEVLKPGQRVVISEGVYRESISPARGGEGPSKMISYEAAPGEDVIVKGSIVLDEGWKKSEGWKTENVNIMPQPQNSTKRKISKDEICEDADIYEIKLNNDDFKGYNPFGLINILHDRGYYNSAKDGIDPFLKRRGMIFVDGERLEQVDLFPQLLLNDGTFWVENNGLTLHVRLPGDEVPEDHLIEATNKEQVFAPDKRYLGYIRVKGIIFEHAGNGFPVPQRGLVSSNRGHHWIIEDNTIQWANGVGVDLGNESWHAEPVKGEFSNHILRRNTIRHIGVCGLAAMGSENMLVEDNLFEYCGWQRAEATAESAGIKFHHPVNLMFRRNVMRYIEGCSALWLDCGSINCRITANVFADIYEGEAIQMEGNRQPNTIDNNIIWGVKCGSKKIPDITSPISWEIFEEQDKEVWPWGAWGAGVWTQGSDKLTVVNNLIMDCEKAGFYTWVVPTRVIDGRGGTARNNNVCNNIFHRMYNSAVEFGDANNYADGNLYSKMNYEEDKIPGGYLKIQYTAPEKWLNFDAWQEFYGWDENGAVVDAEIEFDPENLTISMSISDEVDKVEVVNDIDLDMFGNSTDCKRYPGPFAELGEVEEMNIDPRIKK
ncbi:MAG: right-handed parallel beta-helix repeat-containing protein [bacterium]